MEERHSVFWCTTEVDNCSFSRRCFMTGEYCSKQKAIQSERLQLHGKNEINAFVVMNFSNMSDVVYRWKLKSFVESLGKHLFFNTKRSRLYCIDGKEPSNDTLQKIVKNESAINEDNEALRQACNNLLKLLNGKLGYDEKSVLSPVEKVNVIRADSNPSSNFVICNRVCQQLQIADLIIVDVSVQNANVFYELGMAVALGKMILPICYSESYFQIKYPLVKDKWDKVDGSNNAEHHIDCFPWRRCLFEHFGMRYRDPYNKEPQWKTSYYDFEFVTLPQYHFSDTKYAQLPYQAKYNTGEKIGEKLYNKLRRSYNESTYEDNTLVVYTMDGMLNETQAARCIVNFYHAIVNPFKDQPCFCGERVGILLQTNKIPEDQKDGPKDVPLLYSVGDIIQIGMNQATYKSHMEMIKPDDYLDEIKSQNTACCKIESVSRQESAAKRFIEDFVQNRCIPVYPADPLYVKRVLNGLQEDIFENIALNEEVFPAIQKEERQSRFYFLYHIMLRTLQFTNEIVVDISTNSIQALFWLGAAHGSDTNAISVRREETASERLTLTGNPEKTERYIFDVAGLWTAVYRSNDTGGFYDQLAKAQSGIEQRSKLILQNRSYYNDNLHDTFWNASLDNGKESIERLRVEKEDRENLVLESYLRNRFWKPMLKYNRLRIYLVQNDKVDENGQTQPYILKWDVDAVACLNNYLSKRTVIGEYEVKTLQENEVDQSAEYVNFLCVGNEIQVERQSTQDGKLLDCINRTDGLSCEVRKRYGPVFIPHCSGHCRTLFKGFRSSDNKLVWLTQHPVMKCERCFLRWSRSHDSLREKIQQQIFHADKISPNQDDRIKQFDCYLKYNESSLENYNPYNWYHIELAQLVLWRDQLTKGQSNPNAAKYDLDRYRVVITGASGPATKALVSVFVDESLKQYDLPKLKSECAIGDESSENRIEPNDLEKRRFPLVTLQCMIREKLLLKFFDVINTYAKALKRNLKKAHPELSEDQIDNSFEEIKKCSNLYLSTVLYKYFFPFLSVEEIQCIHNGMQMYISTLRASNKRPYAGSLEPLGGEKEYAPLPSDVIARVSKDIPKLLKYTLESLRGIEALFEVEVKVNTNTNKHVFSRKRDDKTTDTGTKKVAVDARQITGIRQMDAEDSLRCLFVDGDPLSVVSLGVDDE